jgi:hypothetical protein
MFTKRHLLLAYYQKQGQCLQCQLNRIQTRVQTTIGSDVAYSDDFPQLLQDEIQRPSLVVFCQKIDEHYLWKIKQHYNGFHQLPIVSVEYQLGLYKQMKTTFPVHCAVFDSLVFSEYRLRPSLSESKHTQENQLESLLRQRQKVGHFRFCLTLLH